MNKPRLVRVGWTDFHSSYLEWVLKGYFSLENYNPDENYDKNCILVISRRESLDVELIKKYLEQGNKLILANPWEAQPFFKAEEFTTYLDNILVVLGCLESRSINWKNILNIANWFWYNESLWYTCESSMQFQNYIPNRTNNKLFFMPINRQKEFRTRIVEKFNVFLDNAIWSYAQKFNDSRHLSTRDVNPVAKLAWDRQFEEIWYNDTYFTVAVETGVEIDNATPCKLFVTEKTFKPIAFQHPFMICGMNGTLKFLHNLGFETYDHIFDESYDDADFFEDKLDIIYNNIKNFNISKYLDPMTEEKIHYNYNRFYDRAVVLEGIKQDLIEPLLEWIDAA
jgi:hypothetical protein